MTRYIAWAQVFPLKSDKSLKAPCQERCGKSKWVVNGRTAGLTRAKTTYACDKCLASVMAAQDWS